jgi:hypothetical protein
MSDLLIVNSIGNASNDFSAFFQNCSMSFNHRFSQPTSFFWIGIFKDHVKGIGGVAHGIVTS